VVFAPLAIGFEFGALGGADLAPADPDPGAAEAGLEA